MKYAWLLVFVLALPACVTDEKGAEESSQRADVLSGGFVKNLDKLDADANAAQDKDAKIKALQAEVVILKAHVNSMDNEIRAICKAINGSAVEAQVRALVAPTPVVPVIGK